MKHFFVCYFRYLLLRSAWARIPAALAAAFCFCLFASCIMPPEPWNIVLPEPLTAALLKRMIEDDSVNLVDMNNLAIVPERVQDTEAITIQRSITIKNGSIPALRFSGGADRVFLENVMCDDLVYDASGEVRAKNCYFVNSEIRGGKLILEESGSYGGTSGSVLIEDGASAEFNGPGGSHDQLEIAVLILHPGATVLAKNCTVTSLRGDGVLDGPPLGNFFYRNVLVQRFIDTVEPGNSSSGTRGDTPPLLSPAATTFYTDIGSVYPYIYDRSYQQP